MRRVVSVLVLSLGALLVFGACGGGDDDDPDRAGAAGAPVDREITVRMTDLLRFEPGTITVKTGERVRIVADNEKGTTLHDFSVQEMPVRDAMMDGAEMSHGDGMGHLALHVAVEPGKRGAMVFTATEAGSYEFFCTVTGHQAAGMQGMLVVE